MYDPCFPVAAAPRLHPLVGAVRRALHIGHPVHHAPVHHAAVPHVVAQPAVSAPPSGCVGVVNPVPGGPRILPAGPGPAPQAGLPGGYPGGAAPIGGFGGGLAGIGPVGAGAAAIGAAAVGAGTAGALMASSSPAPTGSLAPAGTPSAVPMTPSFVNPGPGTPGAPGTPILSVPDGTPNPNGPDGPNSVPEPGSVLIFTVAILTTFALRRMFGGRWA